MNSFYRDAYFTLFVDIHPGKVYPFYSVYLTNWAKLPIFGHFYPGKVYHFPENIHPCQKEDIFIKNEQKTVENAEKWYKKTRGLHQEFS